MRYPISCGPFWMGLLLIGGLAAQAAGAGQTGIASLPLDELAGKTLVFGKKIKFPRQMVNCRDCDSWYSFQSGKNLGWGGWAESPEKLNDESPYCTLAPGLGRVENWKELLVSKDHPDDLDEIAVTLSRGAQVRITGVSRLKSAYSVQGNLLSDSGESSGYVIQLWCNFVSPVMAPDLALVRRITGLKLDSVE
jgi:hypothetical protein